MQSSALLLFLYISLNCCYFANASFSYCAHHRIIGTHHDTCFKSSSTPLDSSTIEQHQKFRNNMKTTKSIGIGCQKTYVEEDDALFTEITPDQYSGELPEMLAYPFCYEPHPISVLACDQLREQIKQYSSSHWMHNFGLEDNAKDSILTKEEKDSFIVGKMFGVLVVQTPDQKKMGYLKAYSGTLQGATPKDGFCPMVYDRFDAEGFFKQGEIELNEINREAAELENHPERAERKARLLAVEELAREMLAKARKEQKAKKKIRKAKRLEMKEILTDPEKYKAFEEQMVQESAADQRHVKGLKAKFKDEIATVQKSLDEIEGRLEYLKQLRKDKSCTLQNQLFDQYQFLNVKGEKESLLPIFAETPLQRPPSGAGDCAAPKLLQYAFSKGYNPIAMAEFWWGKSPALEVRKHNFYYPACRGKCEPILGHMLKGLEVGENPLEKVANKSMHEIKTIYEDEYMVVVDKPNEMLSVPGRRLEHSVYNEMKKRYPNATGPLLVHRLDMSTSGILIVAKDKDIHQKIQAQFIDRSIKKRYTALLEGECKESSSKGKIDLPLSMDYLNRPMQKVDFDEGKPAVTLYEVVEVSDGRTRVYFYPETGRTHQLRVHAAHVMGLNVPIVGDDIYGQRDKRLYLHAGFIEMTHPVTQKRMAFTVDAPF